MNTLLGSQPAAHFSTNATIDPTQQASVPGLLDAISSMLSGSVAGATPIQAAATAALPGQLTYQAPQVSAPQAGPAPAIDATQAFTEGVVQPVTQDFLERTLPSIAGNYGRGAGGTFGSESAEARGQAATDTSRSLAQTGSEFALNAAAANQNAALNTLLANLGAQTSTNQLNVGAANQAAAIRNTAQATAPGTAGITAAGTQPFLTDLLNAILQPTQQTSAVGTGGSTGIIQGLTSGVGQAGTLASLAMLGLI